MNIQRYSASKIKTFDQCPLKYKLQYLDEIEIEKAINYDTEFGSFFHEAAKIWDGLNRKEVLALTEKFKFNSEFKSLIAPTLRNYAKFHTKYEQTNYEREQPYELITNELWLYAILDRLTRKEDGTIVITDYKTAKKSNREYHIFQLKFYCYIISQLVKIKPSNIECMIYYPRIDFEDYPIKFKDYEIIKFERTLVWKIKQIQRNYDWSPKPGFLCKYCDFFLTKYCDVK